MDFSKNYEAVLGARQVGGGFGGCVLHIIHEDAAETYSKEAAKVYKKEFGIDLEPFEVRPSAGTYISYEL